MLNNRKKIYSNKDLDTVLNNINQVNKKNKLDDYLNKSSNNTFRSNDYGESVYDKKINLATDINTTDENSIYKSINEGRSREQGIWDTIGIGVGRVGTKVGVELAKTGAAIVGTVGAIGGNTVDLITGEDNTDFLETAFNNDFIKAAEKIQQSINNEYLPVYVSDTVANGNFLDKITSSEFWATDGADGVGYLISAMAPGAVFKGLGLGSKIFGGASKLTALRYGKNIETARKFLTKAGLTIDKIDSFAIPAVNTYFEAGAEAKGVGDAIESKKADFLGAYKMTFDKESPEFIQKVSNKMEELDLDRRSGVISDQEYNLLSQNIGEEVVNEMAESAFKEQKGRAMRNTFLTNLAVLAGPNYIQAKLLYGKNPSKIMLDKITGQAVEKSTKNTVKQGLKRVGESFLSEGSEEVAQTSTEHRNVHNSLKNKLGEYAVNDFDPLTFGKDFIETLGTTEGQVAGFLGGILGAPISIVGGYKQDKADTANTERLRAKINGQSTALDDIYNTNLYEQEEYVNPETNETLLRDKEVDGKKVLIPENVAKVKKALDLQEALSQVYDQAVQDADTDTLEALKKQAEFNIISNFIGEEEVTLDALNEHLKTIFPVTEKMEDGSELSKEQIKQNTENKNRISDVITKAKVLQKDLLSFKDMSQSLIRLNNKDATPKQIEEFLNGVGNAFLSERAEEFDVKQKLAKLEKDRVELMKDMPLESKGLFKSNYQTAEDAEKLAKTKKVKVDENGFAFLSDNEVYKNNPRLNFLNKQIETAKKQLEEYNKTTNELIWNNEFLNKQFDAKIKEDSEIKEALSEENVAKNDEAISKVKEATTTEEVEAVEKTTKNPIVKEKADTKKAEIIKAEKVASEEKIATATQEDNDFNNPTNYDGLTGTEGSITSDELIPQEAENNTVEEFKKIKTEEESAGKGAQVISTYRNDDDKGRWKSGDVIPFMKEQFSNFLRYEKEPIDKSGKLVTFEINNNPGPNKNVNKALNLYNELLKRGFVNMTTDEYNLLYEYLPINVRFTSKVNAPIETKRVATFDKETDEWIEKMDISTGLLRTELINNLRNGVSFENMSTTVQGQYKGLLKVDDNKLANNNILQLDGVKDLKYVRENLHVVNSFGKLQNILTGKTLDFNDGRVKENAKGEIYLMIPQANGVPFPLKLNIKKINEAEASLLYYIYREIITNDKALNTTISEISNDLKEAIQTSFKAELDIIGGNKNDIKLQEIIDLLIYQSDNVKSRMQINDGVLYFGENESTVDTIDDDMNSIIEYLVNNKRHQIKIDKKFDTDNEKTNLKSNSANYLKYLIDNLILSTNAVVNEPTFQGFTNIYLNTSVTVTNQTKPVQTTIVTKTNEEKVAELRAEEQVEKAEIERKKQEELKAYKQKKDGTPKNENELTKVYAIEDVKNINAKYDAEQKQLYDKYDKLISPLLNKNTKISESGAEVDSNNFKGLDFGEQPKITTVQSQPVTTENTISYTPTGKSKQVYSIKGSQIFNSKGEEVFKEDSADRRKIFANFAIKQGRAKVIEDNKGVKYIVNNKLQIMSTTTGKIMAWQENHPMRKLLISKYKSITSPVVSEQGVEINAEDTGLGGLFENNSQNVRNSQENFVPLSEENIIGKTITANQPFNKGAVIGVVVSIKENKTKTDLYSLTLDNGEKVSWNKKTNNFVWVALNNNFTPISEIKGTMENTELKETQTEVFKEVTNVPSATEMRLLNKAASIFNNNPEQLTDSQRKRLEEAAVKYPETYKKLCK